MKNYFSISRLFPKPDDRPRKKVLADRLERAEVVKEFERSPGWVEILREYDRLLHVEHDALMRKENPISAEEYRGFVRALSLAAMVPEMVIQAGNESAEELKESEQEDQE